MTKVKVIIEDKNYPDKLHDGDFLNLDGEEIGVVVSAFDHFVLISMKTRKIISSANNLKELEKKLPKQFANVKNLSKVEIRTGKQKSSVGDIFSKAINDFNKENETKGVRITNIIDDKLQLTTINSPGSKLTEGLLEIPVTVSVK